MEYDHTISGLLRKRTDIAQDIDRNRAQLSALRDDLSKIEAALLVFGHEDMPVTPKPRVFIFKRNELRAHVLDELRKGPRTNRELTESVLDAKGMEKTNAMVRRVYKTMGKAMSYLAEQGFVQSSHGHAGVLIWEMVQRE